MKYLEGNLLLARELRPELQDQYIAAIKKVDAMGLSFRVTCVYRSQETQDGLWKIGRRGIAGEYPVTWTKSSNHTKRIAFDVYIENGMYNLFAELVKEFNIVRPAATLAMGDNGHFEIQPYPPLTTPLARLQGIMRRLNNTKLKDVRKMLTRAIERLQKRL